MDEGLMDLARRLVASSRWRWMPGMLATGDGWPLGQARIVHDDDGTPDLWMYRGYSRGPATSHALGNTVSWSDSYSAPIPDLTDPATVGCLRSLVEVDGRVVAPRLGDAFGGSCWWRLDSMMERPHEGLVTSPVMYEGRYIGGLTLLDALVDALLHAPEVLP